MTREMPPSFDSFCQQFHSEQACADALFAARWPGGFRCPSCSHTRYYLTSTRRLPLYECASCRRQTSIIAGTVMEGSSTPLTRWFQALYLLSQPGGISSNRLSKVLEVTYKTAWLISHKLRHAMQQADLAEQLTGQVRVEPFTYGSAFFPDAKQPLLIGASLDEKANAAYVKIKQPDPRHVNNELRVIDPIGIHTFVRTHTNERNVTVHPLINNSISDFLYLKRYVCDWLNDTFNGIGAKHLQAYLDEFSFRINMKLRKMSSFACLLAWCAKTAVLQYKMLIRDKLVLPEPWRAYGSRAKWRARQLALWMA
ncbi:transposase [Cohnella lubricantis]|uniref:IS1595 family transposase n=1 Tax=Cohnella lubricantis TaxID=2163172 RepID=A0A841TF44_9BACL|nr:transposase [Cohnella lubricantis]MBB6678916.1 IS1595 family transposase [Cohnella lubricantis]MBP2120356.1 transposase-like protein [Cohnella lubricantis]